MSESKNLIDKIDELCPEGHRNQHSYFQLQYFVIGKEPTIQAKIRACKKELLSRKDEIESIVVALEDLCDQRRLHELEIEKIKEANEAPLPEEEQIRIRQTRRRIKGVDHQIESFASTIKAKENEANFLIGLYEKLIEVEPEKDWDSLEVQANYWNAKLTQEIETRLLLSQQPNPEDFKTVMAMPSGLPIKDATVKLIEGRKGDVKKMVGREEKPALENEKQ